MACLRRSCTMVPCLILQPKQHQHRVCYIIQAMENPQCSVPYHCCSCLHSLCPLRTPPPLPSKQPSYPTLPLSLEYPSEVCQAWVVNEQLILAVRVPTLLWGPQQLHRDNQVRRQAAQLSKGLLEVLQVWRELRCV